MLVRQEAGVTDVKDAHPAQHLAHNRLDVLVVDLDALEPVDLLDFVHQILGQLLFAKDAQDVVRVGGAVHERLARLDLVAFAHREVLALGDEEFLGIAVFRCHHHLALALGVLAEADRAVDFGNDGVLFRLARFEQFGYARQTSGDVLGLCGFARNTGDDITCLDLVALGHRDGGPEGQEIASLIVRAGDLQRFATVILERDARSQVGILGLDDALARQTRHFVQLFGHGDTFDDVAELHVTRHFGEDGDRERIPLGQ